MNPLINDFFTAPRSVMVRVMKKLNSQDLTELHDLTQEYIDKNGNNDTLQWLLDKTFEVSYFRGIEENNPGYSCVGYDTFDKVIRLTLYND